MPSKRGLQLKKVSKGRTQLKRRVSKKRVSKKRVSKKRVSKKRVSKKRVSKKRVSKKRVSKKRVSKKRGGGGNGLKRIENYFKPKQSKQQLVDTPPTPDYLEKTRSPTVKILSPAEYQKLIQSTTRINEKPQNDDLYDFEIPPPPPPLTRRQPGPPTVIRKLPNVPARSSRTFPPTPPPRTK